MTSWTQHDDAHVSAAMRELADAPVDATPLPDPSFIWWKAQLLRRHEAEREALAPIAVGDRMHIGGAILGAVALAVGAWTCLPALALTPAVALTVAGSALILLTVLAVAAVESLRDR